MATSTVVPLREYLATSYRPDRDWVDGELRERNMGEGAHSAIQGYLVRTIGNHAKEWQVRVLPEQRVQTSATHFRIPDICITRRSSPFEDIVQVAPLLCIEVLSPNDRMTDMQEKVDDYLQMGVEMVWVVDPRRRTAYQTDGHSLQQVEVLSVHETAIRIATVEVFAELDEFEGRTP